jgi:hypothetical protein
MNTLTTKKPLISEERYQQVLRKNFGEELAAISNLPYEERLAAIADFQNNFDTPHDKVWPAEGYTGPDLP